MREGHPPEPPVLSPDALQKLDLALERLERYRLTHKTEVLTILHLDIVKSLEMQEALKNDSATKLIVEFRNLVEETADKCAGEAVETGGDSYFVVLPSPSDGIICALQICARLREKRKSNPELRLVRAGLHQGQVTVERHERGPKPLDLYGIQISIAKRIMDLSDGDRILCSRHVFDDARAVLSAEALTGFDDVTWVNHGPYQFKGAKQTYEICEVGEKAHSSFAKPQATEKAWPLTEGDLIGGWLPGPDATLPGTNWRMARTLGEGGFGSVWLAEDKDNISRRTVFKVCKWKSKVKSLRREKDVYDRLLDDQGRPLPGIAEVIGAHDDRDGGPSPYYIQLTYYRGGDLRKWIDEHGRRAPLRIKLDVALQMARALGHVHKAGFVHRDIKPSNFLLEEPVGADQAPAIRLTDFGLGQAAYREAVNAGTSVGSIAQGKHDFTLGSDTLTKAAGTYLYIAPELISGKDTTPGRLSHEAGTQADIYSLGVTLYQLFCGNAAAVPGVQLRDLRDPVLRDLVERCVHADPKSRVTLDKLAHGLEHYTERKQAWDRRIQRARTRRQRAVAMVAMLISIISLTLGGIATWQWRVARQQGQRATQERDNARHRLYATCMQTVSQTYSDGRYDLAREALWAAPAELRDWEWGHCALRLYPSLARIPGPTRAPIVASVLLPDSTSVDVIYNDGSIYRFDTKAAASSLLHRVDGDRIAAAVFAPNGQTLVYAHSDKLTCWNVTDAKAIWTASDLVAPVVEAMFALDNERLVTRQSNGDLIQWDVKDGSTRIPLQHSDDSVPTCMAMSNSAAKLVVGCNDGSVLKFDMKTARQQDVLKGLFSGSCDHIAIESTDGSGNRIAVVHDDDVIEIFGSSTTPEYVMPRTKVRKMCFLPGGGLLTIGDGGVAQIWTTSASKQGNEQTNFTLPVRSVDALTQLAPCGGDTLMTAIGDDEGEISLWDLSAKKLVSIIPGHGAGFAALWHTGDNRLIGACEDGEVELYHLDRPEPIILSDEDLQVRPILSAAAQYLSFLSVGDRASSLQGINLSTSDESLRFDQVGPTPAAIAIADSGLVCVASTEPKVSLALHNPLDPSKDKEIPLPQISPSRLFVSSDARWAAIVDTDGVIRLVDTEFSEIIPMRESLHVTAVGSVYFTSTPMRMVWAEPSGELRTLALPPESSKSITIDTLADKGLFALSRGNKYVAGISVSGVLRQWDLTTLDLTYDVQCKPNSATCLSISDDGTAMAVGRQDGTIEVVDTAQPENLLSIRSAYRQISAVAFAPSAKRLFCLGEQDRLAVYDLNSASLIVELPRFRSSTGSDRNGFILNNLRFSPDGGSLVLSDDRSAAVLLGCDVAAAQSWNTGHHSENDDSELDGWKIAHYMPNRRFGHINDAGTQIGDVNLGINVRNLDYENTTGLAREWWNSFVDENKTRLKLMNKLCDELRNRKATITEFFLAYVYSDSENVEDSLAYLDKQRAEKKKKSSGDSSALEASSPSGSERPESGKSISAFNLVGDAQRSIRNNPKTLATQVNGITEAMQRLSDPSIDEIDSLQEFASFLFRGTAPRLEESSATLQTFPKALIDLAKRDAFFRDNVDAELEFEEKLGMTLLNGGYATAGFAVLKPAADRRRKLVQYSTPSKKREVAEWLYEIGVALENFCKYQYARDFFANSVSINDSIRDRFIGDHIFETNAILSEIHLNKSLIAAPDRDLNQLNKAFSSLFRRYTALRQEEDVPPEQLQSMFANIYGSWAIVLCESGKLPSAEMLWEKRVARVDDAQSQDRKMGSSATLSGDEIGLLLQESDALMMLRRFDEIPAKCAPALHSGTQQADYMAICSYLSGCATGHRDQARNSLRAYRKGRGSEFNSLWQAKVFAYLLEELSEEELESAVLSEKYPRGTESGRKCEFYFYTGYTRLLSGDRDAARECFRRCVDTCCVGYSEYSFAIAELARLGEYRDLPIDSPSSNASSATEVMAAGGDGL